MDAKGETIFRRRPYYYTFEGFTEEQIAEACFQIPFQAARRNARSGVQPSPRYGQATLSFIEHSYLRVDEVEVAGK